MEWYDPTTVGLRAGDVLHVRGIHSFMGKAIRSCLKDSEGRHPWGNHDGTLVYISAETAEEIALPWTGWAVAEAAWPRFELVPWRDQVQNVIAGKESVVLFRPPGITVEESGQVAEIAIGMRGVRYDARAILWHLIKAKLHLNIYLHWKWAWYCTEAVSKQYRDARDDHSLDAWPLASRPTPYTTEKRVAQEKLCAIEAPDGRVVELTANGDQPFSVYMRETWGVEL